MIRILKDFLVNVPGKQQLISVSLVPVFTEPVQLLFGDTGRRATRGSSWKSRPLPFSAKEKSFFVVSSIFKKGVSLS